MNATLHTILCMWLFYDQKANETLSNLEPEEQINAAADLTQQLVQATEPQNRSLLPNDLGVSAKILAAVVDVLENNNATDEVRMS